MKKISQWFLTLKLNQVDVDKEVEKAEECKSLETGKLVEEKVDISDNIVLRKLLVS